MGRSFGSQCWLGKVRKTMYSNAEVLWIKAVIASRDLRAFRARKNCVMKNLLYRSGSCKVWEYRPVAEVHWNIIWNGLNPCLRLRSSIEMMFKSIILTSMSYVVLFRLCLLSSVHYPPSSVVCTQFSVLCLPSSVLCPPSSILECLIIV